MDNRKIGEIIRAGLDRNKRNRGTREVRAVKKDVVIGTRGECGTDTLRNREERTR